MRLMVFTGLANFIWKKKLWWLIPIVILLIFVALLILVGQSSALSPFVYALF